MIVSFGCPIIYTDIIHRTILFIGIDISNKCNAQAHYLNGTPYLTTIASNDNVMKILNSSMLSCTLNAVETFKSHSKFELVQPSAIAISVPRSKFSNCLLADYTGGWGGGLELQNAEANGYA